MSSYRPQYYNNPLNDLPPPSPPPEMPPLPSRHSSARPGPPNRNGDSWRPNPPQQTGIPQRDFTFRNNATAPQFPQNGDNYRPPNGRPRRPHQQRGGATHQRGRGARWPTAARPLLSVNRGSSPEEVLGQTDTQNVAQRYLPADDISDSGEEDMQESEEDEVVEAKGGQLDATTLAVDGTSNGFDLSHQEDNLEPPAKRRATADTAKASKQESSVPRWSNPDPYTVLPPIDENQRKRKDVVKIIRKARIQTEKEVATKSQVAANDDFISFNLGEDSSSDRSPSPGPLEPINAHESGLPGAPSGPRSFTLPNSFQGNVSNGAPGTSEARPSVNSLGPTPGVLHGLSAKPERMARGQDFYPDQAEALGNRKRTYDDNIKGTAPPKATKKRDASNGSVLPEWKPSSTIDPTPWIVDDHSGTESPGFRLHKEICDFYDFVKPQRFEQTVREDLLERLRVAVRDRLPGCDAWCFGSFAAAMYLPNADMDLVVISSTFRTSGIPVVLRTPAQMNDFGAHLERIGLAQRRSVVVIAKAKVPLVKYVDKMTGIRVDVSFENETGLTANKTFNAWKRQFPAMPILATLIKQFLMMRGLNEVVNGGLGGFSVTCLVTSLLQNLPRVQSGEVIPERHLGEMLLEFLDLYGNHFDLARSGISMNPPGYFEKHSRGHWRRGVYRADNRFDRLAIIDPNKAENDISGGSKNVTLIFELFSEAHTEIMRAIRSSTRTSLLDWLLGADYSTFTGQRQRLQELYRTRFGEPEPQASLHQNPPAGHIEDHGTTPTPNSFPTDVFPNPLEPSVVAQKSRELKKPTGKKQESKQNALDSQDANQPSRLTGLSPKKRKKQNRKKNKARAMDLKKSYPSIANKIPTSLSKQAKTQLLQDFKAASRAPKMTIEAGQDRIQTRSGTKQATSSGKSNPIQT